MSMSHSRRASRGFGRSPLHKVAFQGPACFDQFSESSWSVLEFSAKIHHAAELPTMRSRKVPPVVPQGT